ncbi:hypothetical protein Hdeb2414_s0005g00179071 [Helianthus debilis subsp. tardiflorus]
MCNIVYDNVDDVWNLIGCLETHIKLYYLLYCTSLFQLVVFPFQTMYFDSFSNEMKFIIKYLSQTLALCVMSNLLCLTPMFLPSVGV